MTRRGGLGRGLDALLPVDEPEATDRLRDLDVNEIAVNPRQPRRDFDESALDELTTSIAQLGLLQPLLVRATSEGFELVAGERRLRAARRAGLQTVPTLIVETDERGSLERAIVENIHRRDLNPIEEASAYRQLLDETGMTQDELAQRLGRSRAAVTNSLRLLELSDDVKRLLIDGRISAGHGRALLSLEGSPFQKRLAQRIAHEQLSVRETEDLVRRYGSMVAKSPAGGGRPERPALAVDAQRKLSDRLQARVRVETGKRKGKIVIDFASLEELDRLMSLLAPETSDSPARTVVL
jgi:ParB family transcriptional regulator, chromosome partitioning protein